jgi:ribosomal protein S25
MDKQLFIQVCDEVIGQQQGMNGIGTLSEKTVHSVLKNYLSPNEINHEIKVEGFVADICTGNEIIEIQTRNFDKLRRKLNTFLAFAPVTIVYPIHNIKWIRWVNPQTGEISPPRKSPKSGKPYAIFPELYRIKDFLNHPNLNLKIILMDLEEYRFLDGWSQDKKKGSTRCDRIPTELIEELDILHKEDYQRLIPPILEEEFTSKDFKKYSGLSMNAAQTALNVLHFVGAVDRIGKKRNSFIYTRTKHGILD